MSRTKGNQDPPNLSRLNSHYKILVSTQFTTVKSCSCSVGCPTCTRLCTSCPSYKV